MTVSVALSSSPTRDRALVGEPLLAVDDAVQVDRLGIEEGLHRVEGEHDREGRRAPAPPAYGDRGRREGGTRSSVTVEGAVGGKVAPDERGVDGHVDHR